MLAGGMEIGAHTVNHVDLGACPLPEAEREISESVRELERLTGHRVTLFSYPFGRRDNIRGELRKAVEAAGCECMFSAFGGTMIWVRRWFLSPARKIPSPRMTE